MQKRNYSFKIRYLMLAKIYIMSWIAIIDKSGLLKNTVKTTTPTHILDYQAIKVSKVQAKVIL